MFNANDDAGGNQIEKRANAKQAIKRLKLCQIRTDRETQSRAELYPDTVQEYAESMRQGDTFPPIIVYQVGGEFWVVDGFHRLEAARFNGFETVLAEVHIGTPADAFEASAGANQKHGRQRTNADKHSAALMALNKFPDRSFRALAKMAGVSYELVAQLSRSDSSHASVKRVGLDGKQRKMPQRKTAKHGPAESPSTRTVEPVKTEPEETAFPVAGHTEPRSVPESIAPASPVGKLPFVWGVTINSLLLSSLHLLENEGLADIPVYKKLKEASNLVSDLTVLPASFSKTK